MRLLFAKIWIAVTFSMLLVHNLVPHHHHDKEGNDIEQHSNKEDHDHSPLVFHNIDDTFVIKSIYSVVVLHAPAEVAPLANVVFECKTFEKAPLTVFPLGQEYLPPDFSILNTNTFRGPPVYC